MPHNLEIYQPEPSEAARYFTLRRAVFVDEVGDSGLVADRVQMVRDNWEEHHYWEGVEAYLADPNHYVRGVRDEKGPVGYMIAQHCWTEYPGLKYIAYLGLHERARNQGIGTQLLNEFEATQPETSTALRVLSDNYGAKNLYQRHGYRYVSPANPWTIYGQNLAVDFMMKEGANV